VEESWQGRGGRRQGDGHESACLPYLIDIPIFSMHDKNFKYRDRDREATLLFDTRP